MTETRTYLNFAGKRRDGTLVKGIVPQLDGSTYGGDNCGAAAEATRDLIDAQGHTKGSPWPPTGASIRKATGDTVGGLRPDQTLPVSASAYGFHASAAILTWDAIVARLRAGFGVDILMRYWAIDDFMSGSPGFRGNHRGVLVGIRGDGTAIELLWADPLYDGRRAGIPLGPQWLPIAIIKSAARALVIDDHTGATVASRYGLESAYVIVGTVAYVPPPPVPPVVHVTRYAGATVFASPPRHFRTRYAGTNLRRSPSKASLGNVVSRLPAGVAFDGYQWIRKADGKWIGNAAGTRWLLFDGLVEAKA